MKNKILKIKTKIKNKKTIKLFTIFKNLYQKIKTIFGQ